MISDFSYITLRALSVIRQTGINYHARLRPLKRPVATVAINMYPASGSWGGSSIFVHQFIASLRSCGFRAVFDLRGDVDVIFLIDPREDLQNKAFGMEEIRRYRLAHPKVKIVQRINECDQRKNSAFIDELLRKANDITDHTVFISEWLRDYFIDRWYDPARSHSVVYNGSDPAVFHPIGSRIFQNDGVLRLVTHHWSANPMKGFAVYKQLDDMIANGEVDDTELWVIGRWPEKIYWRASKTFAPTSGKSLADLLRQCHVYLTASLWEPCGMHHIEGAQCGLPLLYHEDGGGIVEAGEKYGIGFREHNLAEAIRKMRSSYPEMREQVLDKMPDGNEMVMNYVRIVQRLLAGGR